MSYPKWWDTTITIYNKHEDDITHVVLWVRTIVNNVFWKYVWQTMNVGEQVFETNKILCRIPENPNFLQKYEWIRIPNDLMSNYFTLARGDIIIRGEVNDEIDEYISGKRSTDLISKYKDMQGCFTIEAISLNVGSGRVYPHYLVEGI
jgi:hypothetical protein